MRSTYYCGDFASALLDITCDFNYDIFVICPHPVDLMISLCGEISAIMTQVDYSAQMI